MRSALSGPALGGAGMVGDAISDACLFLARRGFIHGRFAPVRCLPPCFENFTFQSVKHTGIGAHFNMKLIQIWARIRHIYETYLGAFQSKLWPVPTCIATQVAAPVVELCAVGGGQVRRRRHACPPFAFAFAKAACLLRPASRTTAKCRGHRGPG